MSASCNEKEEPVANTEQFPEIFTQLRRILAGFAPPLHIQTDSAIEYYLNAAPTKRYPGGFFFGAMQIKKNYVSYHLMPVYVSPQLLEGITAQLQKRMQGKSCFNFAHVDPDLFVELAALTQSAFEYYQQNKMLIQ